MNFFRTIDTTDTTDTTIWKPGFYGIIMKCRNNNLSSCSLQHLIMPCNRKPKHISKITIFFIICIFRRGVCVLGHCNHVGGILLAVEDFCRRGLKEHGEPVSCTSRLLFP